ncbi:MAG: hypothetical protein Tsb0015_15680 [Simkaniaceae bacterium]
MEFITPNSDRTNTSYRNEAPANRPGNPERQYAYQQDILQEARNTPAERVHDGCSECTCGIGETIIGVLVSMGAVASESFCYLCSGISIAACGVGNFFSGLYKACTGMFGRNNAE